MKDSREAALANLETLEAGLLAGIREQAAELRHVRQALAVLRAATVTGERHGTYELLDDYADSLPPGTPFGVGAAMDYATEHGWRTTALDRKQAMQIALANRARIAAIVRQPVGYRTLTGEEAAARKAELAARPVTRPGPKPRRAGQEHAAEENDDAWI